MQGFPWLPAWQAGGPAGLPAPAETSRTASPPPPGRAHGRRETRASRSRRRDARDRPRRTDVSVPALAVPPWRRGSPVVHAVAAISEELRVGNGCVSKLKFT